MDEIKIKLTDEQRKRLCELGVELSEKLQTLYDVFVEIVNVIMEKVREVAELLGRFFLKKQLLEWRVPVPMADFISQKMYWYWAFQLGFNWFKHKIVMVE